ncbi:MAG: crotonase/enoyl-CoA hydratase family protein [Turneriella sp.]|nr:crotonase/enoyl-CoA hydratase family protein [Turneriella sp.]
MSQFIKTEKQGQVLVMAFNRAEANNAFNTQMLRELSAAYEQMETDNDIRVGVVWAEGKHFTLGLELNEVAAGIEKSDGNLLSTPDGIDPWGISGRAKTKPVVVAGHGFCLTLAIELMLASEIRIATPSAKFAQMEVQRGVFPFGGATLRFHEQCGWGNAMKYMLTGDMFTAAEALRIGLIQEVVELPKLRERALELAQKIADQSPLAVRATLASAHLSLKEGRIAAAKKLFPELQKILKSEDAAEGIRSFQEKRKANFPGR